MLYTEPQYEFSRAWKNKNFCNSTYRESRNRGRDDRNHQIRLRYRRRSLFGRTLMNLLRQVFSLTLTNVVYCWCSSRALLYRTPTQLGLSTMASRSWSRVPTLKKILFDFFLKCLFGKVVPKWCYHQFYWNFIWYECFTWEITSNKIKSPKFVHYR